MLTVTTDVVEGKRVKKRLGIVTCENINSGQGGGMLMVGTTGTAVVLE